MEERTRTRRAPEDRITGRAPGAHALHLGLDVHVEESLRTVSLLDLARAFQVRERRRLCQGPEVKKRRSDQSKTKHFGAESGVDEMSGSTGPAGSEARKIESSELPCLTFYKKSREGQKSLAEHSAENYCRAVNRKSNVRARDKRRPKWPSFRDTN